MPPLEDDAARGAERLRREWEARARSPRADFYIASHPGWRDPEEWERTARADASFILTALDPERLKRSDVLEVGCGVGRMAKYVAPLCRSYLGVDVSPTYVAEARRRCADRPNARFEVCDGLSLPAAADGAAFDMAFSAGVLIHVPKAVALAWFSAVTPRLRVGGEFRFQLLADETDPEGIEVPVTTAITDGEIAAEQSAMESDREDEEALHRSEDYLGHRWRYAEAWATLRTFAPLDPTVLRFNRPFLFGRLCRNA